MPNKPGALAGLARLFAEKGINLLGIASEVRDDSGLVRLAVEGDGDVSGILSKAGFASVETSLISVEVSDKPGELYRATKALADAKFNITTVYGTSLGGGSARILIAMQNADKAKEVLDRLASQP